MAWAHWLMIAVVLAGLGCDDGGSDGEQSGDGGASIDGSTGGASDGGTSDAAPDAAPTSCWTETPASETFALAPEVGETQIHGAVAVAGDSVWLVFNREEADGSKFDVWATRLGCAGETLVPAFQINEAIGFNDVEPEIAVSGDRLIIVWSRDTVAADVNLFLMYRIYGVDGAPIAGERALETERDGEVLATNTWLPAVTNTADGFAVAGSRGLEGVGFQTFVQRLDRDGMKVGAAASWVGQFGQVEPELLAEPDGGIYVAWTEQRDEDAVYHAHISPGADVFDEAPEPTFGVQSSGVRLGVGFVAASVDPGGGSKAGLRRAAFGATDETTLFGRPGALDHSPAVAADGDGGWIAWYRVIQGFRNEVWFQRFKSGGGAPAEVGEAVQIETEAPAAPYGLVLTPLAPGLVFVAWSEGQSPRFTLQGRFIRNE